MKTLHTLILAATLFTAKTFAQTGPENLIISISGGSSYLRPVSEIIEFSATGDNLFNDYDTVSTVIGEIKPTAIGYPENVSNSALPDSNTQLSAFDSIINNNAVLDSNVVSVDSNSFVFNNNLTPFTVSSDNKLIDKFDSRPLLLGYSVFAFGIGSYRPDTITISAASFIDSLSSNISANEKINFVYLEDMLTGRFYQLLNQNVLLPVPANLTYVMNYRLHVMVKPTITASAVTCFGNTNGSIQIHNPNCSNWNYSVSNPVSSSTVFNSDTTINNLSSQFYSIKVYVNNLLADSQEVYVNSPADIIPSFTASNYSPSINDVILFTNQSSGAVAFNWTFGDTSTDTLENPTHSFLAEGNYPVTLTATNANGCTASFTDTIFVTDPNHTLHQAPTFDRSEHASSNPMERNSRPMDVNIATGAQKITVNQNGEGQQILVQIMNVNGQLISSTSTTDESVSFEISQTGIYVVNITSSNGEMISKKIFVNN